MGASVRAVNPTHRQGIILNLHALPAALTDAVGRTISLRGFGPRCRLLAPCWLLSWELTRQRWAVNRESWNPFWIRYAYERESPAAGIVLLRTRAASRCAAVIYDFSLNLVGIMLVGVRAAAV